jgi:hypothetical protein
MKGKVFVCAFVTINEFIRRKITFKNGIVLCASVEDKMLFVLLFKRDKVCEKSEERDVSKKTNSRVQR